MAAPCTRSRSHNSRRRPGRVRRRASRPLGAPLARPPHRRHSWRRCVWARKHCPTRRSFCCVPRARPSQGCLFCAPHQPRTLSHRCQLAAGDVWSAATSAALGFQAALLGEAFLCARLAIQDPSMASLGDLRSGLSPPLHRSPPTSKTLLPAIRTASHCACIRSTSRGLQTPAAASRVCL